MKIKEITWRNRRDFEAVYVCEHCGETRKKGGYDDSNFHHNVIPKMKCPVCDKTSGDNYTPLVPRYSDHQII